MEIERGNLEILFIKIPYEKITLRPGAHREKHDYRYVNLELYHQHAQSVFSCYSKNERDNNYQKLVQDMKGGKNSAPSVFRLIMGMAERVLTYDGDEIKCKIDEMLRWREM